jgi:exocyst complex protein 7
MYQICRDTRSAVLEQSLKKLGVERLSKDDVQKMQWEVLEAKIGNWIHYMRISVRMNMNLLLFFPLLFYFCPTYHSKFI